MEKKIPFNKPFIVGKELHNIAEAVTLGNISGDGHFTEKCHQLLESKLGITKVLMTPSCTAALEMAARLCDLQPGDEVIMPSFTFVTTASAFLMVGAKPVFVDIRRDTLNLDESQIEAAITEKTKAIVPVHYAGVACEMTSILSTAKKFDLTVVEDAAQGVNSFYRGRSLGSIGNLGTFSFHETKNFICGEGGALCLNDPHWIERAEILRDKGTNRKQFFRGEVDRYTWVDLGSSYVPSEINCAFLAAQLEAMTWITEKRRKMHEIYRSELMRLEKEGLLGLPYIPQHCESNYHLFYILLPDRKTRDGMIQFLKSKNVSAVFHYVPLHTSPMGIQMGYRSGQLPNTENLSERLLRLPLYYDLTSEEQLRVTSLVKDYLRSNLKVMSTGACLLDEATK